MTAYDLPFDDEQAWLTIRDNWTLADGMAFLNHGSFGLPHKAVISAWKSHIDASAAQPMDFFVRDFEPQLYANRDRLAQFVGAGNEDIIFVENATYGMSVIAESISLKPGDEILLSNHAYGAVVRCWQRECERAGAKLVVVDLPLEIESDEQVVDILMAGITDQTRLLIFSHITSPTATILPAKKICDAAHQRGVEVCVDGPHAIGMLPLNLRELDCEYYTASCHKWLCAAHGTGFLYVNPRLQETIEPVIVSWGRLLPAMPETWQDHFTWSGTRDFAAYLSLSAAFDFLEPFGYDLLRKRTHYLAQYARETIRQLSGMDSYIPDDAHWYGPMIAMPVASGNIDWKTMRDTLRSKYQVEPAVYDIGEQRIVRVSCYLYNSKQDIDQLVDALKQMAY